jgi:hypothetical protein
MPYTMVEDSPCILLNPTNSSQVVGYLKYEPREACQDNEALWSRPMVMSGPHYFVLSYESNDYINTKALSQSQGKFHIWFSEGMLLSHELPPPIYGNHCRFYDKIEAWLEGSYLGRFPMNNNHVTSLV